MLALVYKWIESKRLQKAEHTSDSPALPHSHACRFKVGGVEFLFSLRFMGHNKWIWIKPSWQM